LGTWDFGCLLTLYHIQLVPMGPTVYSPYRCQWCGMGPRRRLQRLNDQMWFLLTRTSIQNVPPPRDQTRQFWCDVTVSPGQVFFVSIWWRVPRTPLCCGFRTNDTINTDQSSNGRSRDTTTGVEQGISPGSEWIIKIDTRPIIGSTDRVLRSLSPTWGITESLTAWGSTVLLTG
jgi:hypothetical protein